MSDAATLQFIKRAAAWARELETREIAKGKKIPEARASIARRAGVAPGLFENLRRGRAKVLNIDSYVKLQAALIAELTEEIGRLEQQITILKRTSLDPREDVVAEAQAHVDAARLVLKGAAG